MPRLCKFFIRDIKVSPTFKLSQHINFPVGQLVEFTNDERAAHNKGKFVGVSCCNIDKKENVKKIPGPQPIFLKEGNPKIAICGGCSTGFGGCKCHNDSSISLLGDNNE